MKNQYDIFISYRRDAFESANLIHEKLKAAGYRVFFDLESMRSGKFNDQLLNVIEQCKDFILVLPENALDRCADPNDWLRIEILQALKCKKNIVPVMLRNFTWPQPMPDGMNDLDKYQGVSASSHEFFDMSVQRLQGYLKSKPHRSRRRLIIWLLALIAVLLLLLVGSPYAIQSLSSTYYKQVADNLTQQTSILYQLRDISESLKKSWSDISAGLKYEKTDWRRKELAEQFGSKLDEALNDIGKVKALMPQQLPTPSLWQSMQLGVRDIDVEDVALSYPFCATFFDDIEQLVDYGKMFLEGNMGLEVQKTLSDDFDVFAHSSNMFYYAYLSIMSKMPESALSNYRKLVPQWTLFPNGVGLNHSDQEYEQYIEQEVHSVESIGFDLSKRSLQIEQKYLELVGTKEETDQKYVDLYQDYLKQCKIDPGKSAFENWSKPLILADFLSDAIEMENDPEMMGNPLPTDRVLADLSSVMEELSAAFGLAYITQPSLAYYKKVVKEKGRLGGFVVHDIKDAQMKQGDIIVAFDDKPATVDNYQTFADALSKGKVLTLSCLRLQDGVFSPFKAQLNLSETPVEFWPLVFPSED